MAKIVLPNLRIATYETSCLDPLKMSMIILDTLARKFKDVNDNIGYPCKKN